jgi:hypothetical protein
MDVITDLLLSEEWDQHWVIIDRYTTMPHCIPPMTKNKRGKDLAIIFLKEIWRLHRILADIISDHDTRSTSKFWNIINCNTWYTTMDVDSIPSATQWSDQAPKSGDQYISLTTCTLTANLPGRVHTPTRVSVQ